MYMLTPITTLSARLTGMKGAMYQCSLATSSFGIHQTIVQALGVEMGGIPRSRRGPVRHGRKCYARPMLPAQMVRRFAV
jgi:hypothetical protein